MDKILIALTISQIFVYIFSKIPLVLNISNHSTHKLPKFTSIDQKEKKKLLFVNRAISYMGFHLKIHIYICTQFHNLVIFN